MNKTILTTFKQFGNKQIGYLSFLEKGSNISFEIKRIYFIYNTPHNITRGRHAHKNLQQIAFCPYGKIEITLDDGNANSKHILDQPNKSLYIGKGIWHEMKWLTKNSVLCVLASEKYDEDDYIRNYNEFKKMVKEGFWDEK
jgi:dTDP-4-dehydrorhamnose 3,5-epimerase-like enzyme